MKKVACSVLVSFLVIALIFAPAVAYSQNINAGVVVERLGSTMGQWSQNGRLIPTLLKAGLASAWVVSGLSPAALGLIAAGMLYSYAVSNPTTISGFQDWLVSKNYAIQGGVYKSSALQDVIPSTSAHYTPMANRIAALGYVAGNNAQGYATYAAYDAAKTAYINYLQTHPGNTTNWGTQSSDVYDPGTDFWYKSVKIWNGESTLDANHVDGEYYVKYLYTCFKNSGGSSPWVQETVYSPVAATPALAAVAVSDAVVADLSGADGAQKDRVRALWGGMEQNISNALANPNHALNTATTAVAGVTPVKVAQDELNKGVPDADKSTLVTSGAVPAAGTNVNTGVTGAAAIAGANPDVIPNTGAVAGNAVDTSTPVTVTYTKTAWSDYGNLATQFNSFMTSLKATGLFSLSGALFGGMPSGGASSISFNGGVYGQHEYDFAVRWSGILATIKALILCLMSYVAVRIVILKR